MELEDTMRWQRPQQANGREQQEHLGGWREEHLLAGEKGLVQEDEHRDILTESGPDSEATNAPHSGARPLNDEWPFHDEYQDRGEEWSKEGGPPLGTTKGTGGVHGIALAHDHTPAAMAAHNWRNFLGPKLYADADLTIWEWLRASQYEMSSWKHSTHQGCLIGDRNPRRDGNRWGWVRTTCLDEIRSRAGPAIRL